MSSYTDDGLFASSYFTTEMWVGVSRLQYIKKRMQFPIIYIFVIIKAAKVTVRLERGEGKREWMKQSCNEITSHIANVIKVLYILYTLTNSVTMNIYINSAGTKND